jgi:hypothetical protein
LEIEEFKSQVSGWPRDGRGRLILSPEKYALIEEVFSASGLSRAAFGGEVSLSVSTLYEALRRSRQGLKSRQTRRPEGVGGFERVKVVESSPGPWVVSGPHGIKVTCANIDQLKQLWRALC